MKHKSNQDGVVSLLVVIFIAILLTLITLAFLRLSITEHRQSVDEDLTTRAYYAAESGVEDAKRAITKYIADETTVNLEGDTCKPADVVTNGVLSTLTDTEYTCQRIDLTPDAYENDLDAWETAQIPLHPANGAAYDEIKISWHRVGNDYDQNFNPHDKSSLPDVPTWNGAKYPALLRVNLFSTPKNGALKRSNIFDVTGFVNPHSGSGPPPKFGTAVFDTKIVDGACDSSATEGQYACSITLTLTGGSNNNFDPSNRINYLRIESIYRGTNLRVALVNSSSGSEVAIEDVQAIVDVTGRAGDVYRRVQARISLLSQDPFPFPDFAIQTADDICKNFSITDDAGDFITINPGIVAGTSCAP